MRRYDANVDLADRWGGTALTAALRHGHLAIAKMLMSCEAKLGSHADPDLVQVDCTMVCFSPHHKFSSYICCLPCSCHCVLHITIQAIVSSVASASCHVTPEVTDVCVTKLGHSRMCVNLRDQAEHKEHESTL